MGRIIAIANQKGGVGKTTSTFNFAHTLARRGKKVLAIDADPQASLTFLFGADERSLQFDHKTLYFSLVKDKPLASLILGDNPALVPSSIILSKADRELMSSMNYTANILRDKLVSVRDDYDYILIDCPPTLTILTSNALTAADLVLIPAKTDLLSIIGVPLLLDEIEDIRARHNNKLEVWGVLPTLYNAHYNQDKEALEGLGLILAEKSIKLFDPIPKSTAYDKASSEGQPTIILSPNAPGVENYYKLADQIINHGK
jgi:chromosome partitioning protein